MGIRMVSGLVGAAVLCTSVMAAAPPASAAADQGYYLVAADGGVFSFGDAVFYGSAATYRLAAPIVGMTDNLDGDGYWLVGRDGGIFAFGKAPFLGSAAGRLDSPVIGIATVTGAGGAQAGYIVGAANGSTETFLPGEGPGGDSASSRPGRA